MKPLAVMTALMLLGAAEAALAQTAAPDGLYQRGVQARMDGRNQEAVDILLQAVAAEPGDVDARLNLGLAYLALDRLDEAEAALDQVLAAAPDYTDAHLGLARVAQRRGDMAAARAALAAADRSAPGRADVARATAEIASASPRAWRVDVATAYSRLEGDLPPWRAASIALNRRLNPREQVTGTLEHTERFGRTDDFLEITYARRIGAGGAYVAVGGAPDADHRPELSLRAGGQTPTGPLGLALTVDGAVAEYQTGRVTTVQPGFEHYLLDGRVVVRGRWINVWDETGTYRDGYAVSALWSVTPAFRLRAGFADAPESSDGATVDVRASHVGAELDLDDRITLRLNGLSEERAAYDRREFGVGVGLRF